MTWVVCFDTVSENELEELVEREQSRTRKEQGIRCTNCGERVTSARSRIEQGGAHEHRFTNPHGLQFHIGCFREAPGCENHGPATHEYTWFDGFAWQITTCRRCGTHLGWSYRSGGGDGAIFYGLILDRLRTDS